MDIRANGTPVSGRRDIRTLKDIEAIETTPLEDWNLPRSTYELIQRSAQENPDVVAIRYIENGDRWKSCLDETGQGASVEITYAALLGKVNQTANLFKSYGLEDTDAISMILPNVPEAHYVLWGGEACGIINPINFMLEDAEIGEIVQSAGSRAIVLYGAHDEIDTWGKLAGILKVANCVEHVFVVGHIEGETPCQCIDFQQELEKQPSDGLAFARDIAPDATASLFHTGGTTGLPKLAQHTHENEVYTAWALNSLRDDAENTCYLTGLPLFHCNAAIGTGLSVFMGGGTVFLAGINGYRSAGILLNIYQLIEYYKVSHFSAVPTVIGIMTQLPVGDFDISSMQFAVCGAAPMPKELFSKFLSTTGIRLLEGYGLTEATVCSSMTPPACEEPRVGSIGLRLPFTQMKTAMLGADGSFERDCEWDEVGMLLISGPSVTPGYTDPERNKGLFTVDNNGQKWLVTGDLARQDEDGYFWLTGREKELIIRGGHNIDPKTIEEALAKHPAVNLVAAVGRPDKYAGEIPVAYIDVVAPVDESELLAFCEQHIGERAAIPKAIMTLEQLPVTGVGKIHKPTLNLLELEKTVERELATISDSLDALQVKAASDPKYGSVVTIEARVIKTLSKESVEQQINELLGGYSMKYKIVLD